MFLFVCLEGEKNHVCDCLQLPCHLESHIPSSKVDLEYVLGLFSCVQAIVHGCRCLGF